MVDHSLSSMTLTDLVMSQDDPAFQEYRKLLGVTTARGVNMERSGSGFMLKDTESVARVDYPSYASLSQCIRDAERSFRKDMTALGVAELRAVTTGDEKDMRQLKQSMAAVNKSLGELTQLLLYDRVMNGARPQRAKEQHSQDVARVQDQYNAEKAAAEAAQTDADRDKHLKGMTEAQAGHAALLVDSLNVDSVDDVIVLRAPNVKEESARRSAEREKVRQRNLKVKVTVKAAAKSKLAQARASKSIPPKKKAAKKADTTKVVQVTPHKQNKKLTL